ncbi:MAG: hypothetical protein MUE64_10150 [Ignavibacteriaceae bacterium]|nr:hypothetical protein [Ignavibacteriaceae bacterium]
MEKRIYNFSAGPGILPEEVLLEAQKDLFTLPFQVWECQYWKSAIAQKRTMQSTQKQKRD